MPRCIVCTPSAQLIARRLVLDFFDLAINVDRASRVLQNAILIRLDFLRLALDVRPQSSPPTARAPPTNTTQRKHHRTRATRLCSRLREIRGKLKSRTGQWSVRDFNFLEFSQHAFAGQRADDAVRGNFSPENPNGRCKKNNQARRPSNQQLLHGARPYPLLPAHIRPSCPARSWMSCVQIMYSGATIIRTTLTPHHKTLCHVPVTRSTYEAELPPPAARRQAARGRC